MKINEIFILSILALFVVNSDYYASFEHKPNIYFCHDQNISLDNIQYEATFLNKNSKNEVSGINFTSSLGTRKSIATAHNYSSGQDLQFQNLIKVKKPYLNRILKI